MASNTPTTANGAAPQHRKVVPSEVGWQFVPQYYNFVNKEPERLHCFYNKSSTFIHGTEGEDGETCHGQQEIHAQITSLGFRDCKIFIHSVDAQSSADGGIIIQVIGEMSNDQGPWRKFVQTFFLAEQPNGYFVLNDIFRFLREDAVESEVEEEGAAEGVAGGQQTQMEGPEYKREMTPPPPQPPVDLVDPTAAPVPEPPTTVAEIVEPVPAPAAVVPPPVPEPEEPAAVEVPQQNGIPAAVEEKPATPAPVAAATETSTPSAPTPPPVVPAAPATSTPAASVAPPIVAAASPAPAPVPAAAPTPKTWAYLAATNSKKWGSAVAQESRGSSENVPSSPAHAGASGSGSAGGSGRQTPVRSATGGGTPSGGRTPHPAYVAAQGVSTPQCFIKSVTENVTQQSLTSALARFGAVKSVEIVRHKACAFAEFQSVESARRAIVASLSTNAGGEGGVKVDVGGGEAARIIVETKKERGDRPVGRGRGGPGGGQYGEGRGAGEARASSGAGSASGGGGSGAGGSGDRGGFRAGRGGGRGRGGK